jgi:tetratricopeptide (TPR) repeat protein
VSELDAAVAAGEAGADVYDVLAAIHADRQEWNAAAELQAHATDTTERRKRQAYLLLRAGRIREAHELYGALVAEGDREALFNRGVTSALMGDDEAAAAAYTAVLGHEADHARARLYLGNAQLRSGRWREAAETYRKFLDLHAGDEEAERVRRILKRIAPDLPPGPPSAPVPAPRPAPAKTDS